MEEESEKRLIELEKRLRQYQREKCVEGKLIDGEELFKFAGTLTNVIGKVLIRMIDYKEHNDFYEQKLISSSDHSDHRPFVTYPTEKKALNWSPPSDSTEQNSTNSPIQGEKTDTSSTNHNA